MSAPIIRLRRGAAALPSAEGKQGEPHYRTGRKGISMSDGTNWHTLVPFLDDLVAMGSGDITANDDKLLIHDASAEGVKEKAITIANFKTALNIPAASSDEKVAVDGDGTPGYLEDILHNSTAITWHKGEGAEAPTLSQMYAQIGVIDCGEFTE